MGYVYLSFVRILPSQTYCDNPPLEPGSFVEAQQVRSVPVLDLWKDTRDEPIIPPFQWIPPDIRGASWLSPPSA